ncbi:hypothetical protein N7532_006046 [Penicillium argentinense]|uniref:Uncharacterized protein n=1 Tax=Penicillium argentinense TaxID=1131581 RepID=A0A9W9KAI2_9EURO|nr:uncharacterized protein N7532_006046 [Penicillium argentinense]KAJ5099045.1 hypothetical protein N7532_006046 [Penicillium argentinense]
MAGAATPSQHNQRHTRSMRAMQQTSPPSPHRKNSQDSVEPQSVLSERHGTPGEAGEYSVQPACLQQPQQWSPPSSYGSPKYGEQSPYGKMPLKGPQVGYAQQYYAEQQQPWGIGMPPVSPVSQASPPSTHELAQHPSQMEESGYFVPRKYK